VDPFTPADRDATLDQVLKLTAGDPRIDAAVITGSVATGRADRWSDIDLDLVVADGQSCEVVAADWVTRMYQELDVVHHYETAFGSTLVRGLFLGNSLLVDLAFTPSSEFSAWGSVKVQWDRTGKATKAAQAPESSPPTPDWSGEAGFAWHDVLHACAAANRGRVWQSLYFLQRIRNRTLALASERHGHDGFEFPYVDDLPAEERDPMRASLVGNLDPATLLSAIAAATRAFLAELRRGDAKLAGRMEAPVMNLVEAARDTES
jgi:predicted nucleotidyltransferase